MASPPIINNNCHSPPPPSSSLRDKLKSRICCFRLTNRHNEILEPDSDDDDWRRKTTNQALQSKNRKKRRGSADFSYDLASYSLNFEDENSREDDNDELPLNNFLARLPATPVRFPVKDWAESPRVVTAPAREVVAWS